MNDDRHDGFADVINLLAAPIAGGIRTVEQMRRGVDEIFRTVENLNRTIENLNEAATRINTFLSTIEEPLHALIPQVTRTVQTVDEITTLLEGPVRATAPNLQRIAEALGTPAFLALPQQLGELMQRLGPLTQLAETAGGLFGGLRVPGLSRPTPAPPAPAPPTPTTTTSRTAATAATTRRARSKATNPPATGRAAGTTPRSKAGDAKSSATRTRSGR